MAWLDAARALMLVLGVPFHASEMYRLSGGWRLEAPDTSFAATAFGAAVHAFRMPTFFVLAGFFAAMLLARRTAREWLTERCLRLGLPLVFSTLAFGWLESAIARAHREGLEPLEAVRSAWRAGPGDWTHHRWFLVVVLLYCVTTVALRRRVPGHVLERTVAAVRRGPAGACAVVAALMAWPFGIAGIGRLAGAGGLGLDGSAPYANFYLLYAVFFALGHALYRVDGSLDRFLAPVAGERALATLAIGAYLATYPGFHAGGLPEGPVLGPTVVLVRTAVDLPASLLATRLFLRAARRRLGAPTPRVAAAVAYLVEGALCIYLVHEVFVLALGARLADVALPATLEIAIVSTLALALSVASFELARRSSFLRACLVGARRS